VVPTVDRLLLGTACSTTPRIRVLERALVLVLKVDQVGLLVLFGDAG
jgi:hypothetical protein